MSGFEGAYDLDLAEGSTSGRAVMSYKNVLRKLDYAVPGMIDDGVFDQHMRMSVEDFQMKRNLPVTGKLDAKTREVLDREYEKWRSEQSQKPRAVDRRSARAPFSGDGRRRTPPRSGW